MSTDHNPWKTLHRATVYDNAWISVSHREVLNPAGNPGIYGLVHFKNLAIGIVPLDEDYNTWLVGQFRYTLNAYSWEIPEGGCPLGTAPLATAKRELQEETGITAKKWTPILDVHTSNSVTDEAGIAYVAQELQFGQAAPEDTEELVVKQLPFAAAVEMVVNGEITDALSMVAIMKVSLMMERGLL